ncbi:MAG: pyridoxamine 5'-phosphate oxidase family protein [Myxococcota bacterium]
MATWFDAIDDQRRAFIERQHLFFVATAPIDDGPVNLSPKGRCLLRVLGPNLVGYADYPGSGDETARHLAQDPRITLMVCSFDRETGIVRLYGRGRRAEVDDPAVAAVRERFGDDLHPYVRQVFLIEVDRVQSSCGYAVPRMTFVEDRDTLDEYCARKLVPRDVSADGLVGGPLVRR